MKKKCIVVAGPTAVGKTELSIELAKALNGSVISADSMQIYKGMDIGSAKVTKEEMQGVVHYLIDELDPKDEFHVVKFQQMAKQAMEEIYAQGKLPIIVGGTGFYIQAILRDIDFTDTGNEMNIRSKYRDYAFEHGNEALHELLRQRDPKAALEIHPNNIKRVIRALEFFDETGTKISEHNEIQHQKETPYVSAYFVLNDDRQLLYERIDKRVDKMINSGLLAEVERLREKGMCENDVSMKGIGYREFFAYFNNEATFEETVEKIKADTRHFAKRQITWFKREKDAIWIERNDYDNDNKKILEAMIKKWKEIENNV